MVIEEVKVKKDDEAEIDHDLRVQNSSLAYKENNMVAADLVIIA